MAINICITLSLPSRKMHSSIMCHSLSSQCTILNRRITCLQFVIAILNKKTFCFMRTCKGPHLLLGTFQTACSFPSNVDPNYAQSLGSHPYPLPNYLFKRHKKPYNLPYTQAGNWPPSFKYPPKGQDTLLDTIMHIGIPNVVVVWNLNLSSSFSQDMLDTLCSTCIDLILFSNRSGSS